MINPECYVHNSKPFWSTRQPECLCATPPTEEKIAMQLFAQAELIKSMRDEISVMQKRFETLEKSNKESYATQRTLSIWAGEKELFERIEKLESKGLDIHNNLVDNILGRLVQLENPGVKWHVPELPQKCNPEKDGATGAISKDSLEYCNELAERINKLADAVIYFGNRLEAAATHQHAAQATKNLMEEFIEYYNNNMPK